MLTVAEQDSNTESRSGPVVLTPKLKTVTVASTIFSRLKWETGPAQIQGLSGSGCKVTWGRERIEGRAERCNCFSIHL